MVGFRLLVKNVFALRSNRHSFENHGPGGTERFSVGSA